jgi:SecD/SecF fusion protein
MKLPSRTTWLIMLVLLLTIGVSLAWHFYEARQPDIDAVGGTILVYEIDRRDMVAHRAKVDTQILADALQRRFGVDGLRHVKVRPGGADQVEVIIPRVGDHDNNVFTVKQIVARVGELLFRILANSNDDREAIQAARQMVNEDRENDAKLKQVFADAQAGGLPPPGLRGANGELRKFHLRLAHGQKSIVSYHWVELGPSERQSLNLDAGARDDLVRGDIWKEATAQRGKAAQLPEVGGPMGPHARLLLQGAVFYFRTCEDRNLLEKERQNKELDIFVLARDPEFDPATGKSTPEIDGTFLAAAFPDRDATGRAIVGFNFNKAGAELFGTLTRKNVREDNVLGAVDGAPRLRHLAIILDGLVMSAPTINSEIRDRGSISGEFTDRQISEMVGVLRAGRLPAALLPQPVRETVVEAGQRR